MLLYNIEDGYLDAIVRGYRSGLLSQAHYLSLVQCESLEDLKLQLSATDYGPFLQYEAAALTTTLLAERLTSLYVQQFRYLRANACQPLAQFLDYITYGYMIDNVILLITGTLHERDTNELLDRCHPLGTFDGMAALTTASTPAELYNSVLVETPLAGYFGNCISAKDLDDLNIEIIRNTLYKAYLEDFYAYCSAGLSSDTQEAMKDVLMFEADRRVMDITANSFGTELNKKERARMYPNFGRLYPEGSFRLAACDDMESLKAVLNNYPDYRAIVDSALSDRDKSLDDRFFEYEVELNKKAFYSQFHYAVFYSYARLKEQEIRNIVWIAECISQRQRDKIGNYIPIF